MYSKYTVILLFDGFLVGDDKFVKVFQGLQVLVDEVDVALPPAQWKLNESDSDEYDNEIDVQSDGSVDEDCHRTVEGQLVEDKEEEGDRTLPGSQIRLLLHLIDQHHISIINTTALGEPSSNHNKKLSQSQFCKYAGQPLITYLAIMQSQSEPILLFVNSGSGGGVGKALVELQIDRINFALGGQLFSVYFYNMRANRDQGFNHLKQLTQKNTPVIAVICGGDGTVMWVVSEIAKNGIDPKLVHLAIIPLGTGNDFSRNLGWGKQQSELTENGFQELKRLVQDWKSAQVQDLDVWQVQVQVEQQGRFEKVQNSEDALVPGKVLTKHFVNYFSFGIDGEIGYEFDKRRTTSRLGNLAVYGAMGIMTGLQKVKTLGELVEKMSCEGQTIFQGNSKGLLDYVGNPFSFNFNDLVEGVKKINSFHNNQNLLALNINSYMAGVTDIWKKADLNQHIIDKNPSTQPSHSDGKIEFVSFSDTGKIGLEKAFGKLDFGFAERITQGSGPFFIKFRSYPDDSDYRTFLQIDGEFIKAVHPKQIILKKSTMFPASQIRVLHRR